MKDIKPVVTGIHDFEYLDNSLFKALFGASDNQNSDAKLTRNNFSSESISTGSKCSIDTSMKGVAA